MSDLKRDLISEVTALEGYRYRLWAYQVSHSLLTVRATHPDRPKHNIHLTFALVYYLQMPTGWRGDLRLASESETRAIAERAGLKLTGTAPPPTLFKAESPKGVVYILGTIYIVKHDVEPVY
jgi:hypothetical protein